jgi:benzoate membrane transport protein
LKTISCCAGAGSPAVALYPRFAVVRCWSAAPSPCFRRCHREHISLAFVAPEYIAPQFTPSLLLSVGVPFFLVTMARKTPPVRHDAGFRLSGARVAADCRHRRPGADTVAFGVYSICIAAITAAICQSPEAHPDPQRRWLAAAAAGGYLSGRPVRRFDYSLMSALPTAWIQMLAGLALLGRLAGVCFRR